jgi:hypothetical protein
MVAGGDLSTNAAADAATSNDGGQTWTLTKKPPVQGAIFCLAYARGIRHGDGQQDDHERDHTVVITAETQPNFDSGSAAWTPDEGGTWFGLPAVSGYWAVAFADPKAGWFVGNGGQILKISFYPSLATQRKAPDGGNPRAAFRNFSLSPDRVSRPRFAGGVGVGDPNGMQMISTSWLTERPAPSERASWPGAYLLINVAFTGKLVSSQPGNPCGTGSAVPNGNHTYGSAARRCKYPSFRISPVSREAFDALCGLSSHPISCHSDYSSSHRLHRVVEFCWLRRCADASSFPCS